MHRKFLFIINGFVSGDFIYTHVEDKHKGDLYAEVGY